MGFHSNLTTPESVHPAAYKQSSDPGTVGAGKEWIDTSSGAGTQGSPYIRKVRNSTNTAWEFVGGSSVGATGASGPTGASGNATTFIYINIQEQQAQNTDGGTFTSGADRTRVLNTIDSDTTKISALASNQLTLPAGRWKMQISAPARGVGPHQAWLHNATDNVVLKRGSTEDSNTTNPTTTRSVISGEFTIDSAKLLEVRHRCTTTASTNGFGSAANFGTEIYTIAEFWYQDGGKPIGQMLLSVPSNRRTAKYEVYNIQRRSNTTLPI